MLVVLGSVKGAHGVRGTLKCAYVTDRPETLARYPFYLVLDEETGEVERLTPTSIVTRHADFLIEATEISDRDAAERLRFRTVEAPLALVPPRLEGEYFPWELEGLSVMREDGTSLGAVTGVVFTPAGAVLEVLGPAGELLVPFAGESVLEVDKATATITVSNSVGAGFQ